METIRIRKAGYPIRHDYLNFVSRYRVLVPGLGPVRKLDLYHAAKAICTRVLGESGDFQLGKTKVFLKDNHDLLLEQEYERGLTRHATNIQKVIRGWIQRKKYEKMRTAAIVIQKYWRGYSQRKKYQQVSFNSYGITF